MDVGGFSFSIINLCVICALLNHEVPKNFTAVPGLCIKCELLVQPQAFRSASVAFRSSSSKSANVESLASCHLPNKTFCKGWAGPLKVHYPPTISSTGWSQESAKGRPKKNVHKVLSFSQRISVEYSVGGRHYVRPPQSS